jgi:surface antigen
MNPLLAVVAISFKKEIRIALISLGVIVSLPFIALFSVTNVSALKDQTVTLYTNPISPTNGYAYDFGFCTYWAALRREQTGKPIPSNWGNANTWDDNARADGYPVVHSPEVGAIMQTDAGPLGHVAFVESVGTDGSWTISEMNFKGWDEVDSRTLPADAARLYNFIR